jgi:hypothetical protein
VAVVTKRATNRIRSEADAGPVGLVPSAFKEYTGRMVRGRDGLIALLLDHAQRD